MADFDLKHADPRAIARAAEYINGRSFDGPGNPSPSLPYPQRGPVAMPVGMPGPSGGGYNRYREMTLEEMLLENRVVFLIGEINHVSASRVIMQMLYLQSVKRDQDINL